MVIELTPELEAALTESARRQGVSAAELAVRALRERFLPDGERISPRDEWERLVLSLGSDCGVTLPDSAVSSEGLYE